MGAISQPNPWIGVNYLPNAKQATPPAYWLQRLYDYDAELVVFPSFLRPGAYVLARRAQQTHPLTNKALADTITQLDTKFCLQHGLVPVSLIIRTGTTWSIDNIIADLKSRDIWARGGGDKVADQMDAQDAANEKRTKDSIHDDLWARSGDAWRSYQARTGQRNKLTVPEPRTGAAGNSPSGSTAGSGIVITG
jgi:hypothetical protein